MTSTPKIDVAGHRGMVGCATRIDQRYFSPTKAETLLGDPIKANQKLGWIPEITVQEMCAQMVAHDLAEAKKHAMLKQYGYSVNVSIE